MPGTDDPLAFAGPAELARAVRGGDVSPRELVSLFLGRIAEHSDPLNAFRVILAEQALAEAEALGSDPEGRPLFGVPFAVKDNMALAGQVWSYGTRSPRPVATADSEIVRRLRLAGAIPVGVTQVPELMAYPWTATAANGVTRNPWDPTRTPGGSSGGSAAAVAARLVPFATASDGGGSIRIPAACCGFVGLKPTRGRVSMAPLADGWRGLSVSGAYAIGVADTALLLDAIHGSLPGDADRAPAPSGRFLAAAGREPGRLRIAVSTLAASGRVEIGEDQRNAWQRTVTRLAELGHHVEERDPNYGHTGLGFLQTYLRGVADGVAGLEQPELAEDLTRQIGLVGRTLVPEWRAGHLRRNRDAIVAPLLALWAQYDVLVLPTLAQSPLPAEGAMGRAFPAAAKMMSAFSPFTAVFNLTGQPAVAVPAGFDAGGLPLSVQLVGRIGAEETLLSVAAQLEAAAPWDQRPPGY